MLFWMLGVLVLFLIIDIIILACWETKDSLYRTLKQVRSQPEYECFQVSYKPSKQVVAPSYSKKVLGLITEIVRIAKENKILF